MLLPLSVSIGEDIIFMLYFSGLAINLIALTLYSTLALFLGGHESFEGVLDIQSSIVFTYDRRC